MNHPATPAALLAHSSWLCRLARELVRDGAEADDAVQETWLRILESGGGDPPRSPRAWLAGVLRHVVATRRRGDFRARERERTRAIRISAESSEPDALDGLVAVERQRSLLDLVLALPEEQRRAVVLRYFEGLAPRVIAAREGTSVNTVKSRLQRGLARLRGELEQRHGKDNAWMLWLLPLAKGAKDTGRSAAGAALGIGVAAAVAAVAFASFSVLSQPGGEPVAEPLAAAPAAASTSESAVAPPAADPAVRTPASQDLGGELLVRVVDESDEAPVAGARVDVASTADVPADFIPDVERLCLERGRRAETDENGTARIAGSGPRIVRASLGELVGYVVGLEEEPEVVVRLRSVPRLLVMVVDEAGEPVAGVPVEGGYEPDRDETSWYECVRTTGATGEALFQDPFGLYSGPDGGPFRMRRAGGRSYGARDGSLPFRWREVRIHLPGVPERSTKARRVQPKSSGKPVTLVLGRTGELEVRVLGADGQISDVDGRAWIRTDGGRQGYEAALEGGRAVWPRVALGGVYEVEIALPELGARWSASGQGPGTDGRALIETRRPGRPALVMELVDAQDRPVRTDKAMFHAQVGGRTRDLGRLSSDVDGRLRVELDPALEPLLGSGSEWTLTVHSLRGVTWARGVFPERQDTTEQRLGRVRLLEVPRREIRGRCVTPDGTPLPPGLIVNAMQLTGHTMGTATARDGSFEIPGIFGDITRLEVSDYDGGWHLVEPVEAAGADDVVLQLVRGGRFRARLRLDDLKAFVGQFRVQVVDGATLRFLREGTPDPNGDVLLERLAPGVHRVRLRFAQGILLEDFEGVPIRPDEEAREPRLDSLELGSLMRVLRISATGLEEGTPLQLGLIGPGDQRATLELNEGRVLVPRGRRATLVAGARGKRTVELGEVDRLPEVVRVALEPGLRVELRPKGRLSVPGTLWLELDDHPLPLVLPSLGGIERGESLELVLPSPGTYRLVRQENHDAGGGMVLSSLERVHGGELQVADASGVQVIEIDLDRVR